MLSTLRQLDAGTKETLRKAQKVTFSGIALARESMNPENDRRPFNLMEKMSGFDVTEAQELASNPRQLVGKPVFYEHMTGKDKRYPVPMRLGTVTKAYMKDGDLWAEGDIDLRDEKGDVNEFTVFVAGQILDGTLRGLSLSHRTRTEGQVPSGPSTTVESVFGGGFVGMPTISKQVTELTVCQKGMRPRTHLNQTLEVDTNASDATENVWCVIEMDFMASSLGSELSRDGFRSVSITYGPGAQATTDSTSTPAHAMSIPVPMPDQIAAALNGAYNPPASGSAAMDIGGTAAAPAGTAAVNPGLAQLAQLQAQLQAQMQASTQAAGGAAQAAAGTAATTTATAAAAAAQPTGIEALMAMMGKAAQTAQTDKTQAELLAERQQRQKLEAQLTQLTAERDAAAKAKAEAEAAEIAKAKQSGEEKMMKIAEILGQHNQFDPNNKTLAEAQLAQLAAMWGAATSAALPPSDQLKAVQGAVPFLEMTVAASARNFHIAQENAERLQFASNMQQLAGGSWAPPPARPDLYDSAGWTTTNASAKKFNNAQAAVASTQPLATQQSTAQAAVASDATTGSIYDRMFAAANQAASATGQSAGQTSGSAAMDTGSGDAKMSRPLVSFDEMIQRQMNEHDIARVLAMDPATMSVMASARRELDSADKNGIDFAKCEALPRPDGLPQVDGYKLFPEVKAAWDGLFKPFPANPNGTLHFLDPSVLDAAHRVLIGDAPLY